MGQYLLLLMDNSITLNNICNSIMFHLCTSPLFFTFIRKDMFLLQSFYINHVFKKNKHRVEKVFFLVINQHDTECLSCYSSSVRRTFDARLCFVLCFKRVPILSCQIIYICIKCIMSCFIEKIKTYTNIGSSYTNC